MLCYKIKNRDGLFSTGGKFPKFKKVLLDLFQIKHR
jgi:hypothetical protein